MKRILLSIALLIFSLNTYSQEVHTIKKDTLNSLLEVVVSSKIGVTQIEPQKIRFSTKDLPSQNGGTAGDILKGMASVAMGGSPNHNRDIRYRGLGNGYTTVLINGKQSGLAGNNRETVLDMIPASQIDYIEIISNPSADQTANGINGIVNIVLKKGSANNSNGQIAFFADDQGGYNTGIALQENLGNFNISGNFDKLKRNANKFDSGQQTKFKTDGTLNETVAIKKSEIKSFDNNTASAKIGYAGKKDWSITAEFAYGEQAEDKEKEEQNTTFKNDASFKSGKKTLETENKNSKFYSPAISFAKKWKNSKLEIDFNSNFTKEDKDKLQLAYTTDVNDAINYTALPTRQTESEKIAYKNFFPSASFKTKVSEIITLKTGFQAFLNNRVAEKEVLKLNNTTNVWSVVPTSTFNFDLDENTYASYITTNINLDKFKINLGYRHEYTNIETLASNLTQETNQNNYNIALPNASITYALTDKSYFKSSIGRRLRRPAFADMNPFIEIKSATEIKVGNPDLKPEKAWAYELGYFNEIKKANFGVNVFHRAITDLIQKNITSDADGITTETQVNLNKAISSGVEFLVGIEPNKWYNLNLNYSRFWSEIVDNTTFEGEALKDQTDWTFKAINNFTLPRKINLQIIANFVGPKGNTQESEKTAWFADLGIEKQIYNNGFFSIRVTDVFDTLKKQKIKDTIVQLEEMTEDTPGTIISAGVRWQF